MEKPQNNYVPALGYDWLTRFYDPVLRALVREGVIKPALVAQTKLESGFRVLDLGCGTGTLEMLLKQAQPLAEIVGLDGDPKVLALARAKARSAGEDITFNQGMADKLPYPDDSFDRVVSSLFFHHLPPPGKQAALQESFRVLRPTGELHIADLGKSANPLTRVGAFLVQLLDGFETTSDSVAGRLPSLIAAAGFADVRTERRVNTPLGTIHLVSARKAG